MSTLVADRRLCVTADRSEVVEEGDVRAAWLLASEGRTIGPSDVERYGLSVKSGKVVIGGVKQTAPSENKMVAASENKARENLPEDIPGREALLAAGVESIGDLERVEDLTEIVGIGRATAAKIREYVEGEE